MSPEFNLRVPSPFLVFFPFFLFFRFSPFLLGMCDPDSRSQLDWMNLWSYIKRERGCSAPFSSFYFFLSQSSNSLSRAVAATRGKRKNGSSPSLALVWPQIETEITWGMRKGCRKCTEFIFRSRRKVSAVLRLFLRFLKFSIRQNSFE